MIKNGNNEKNNHFFTNSNELINSNYKKMLIKIGYKENMSKNKKEILYKKWQENFSTKHPKFKFPCVTCKKPTLGSISWDLECYASARNSVWNNKELKKEITMIKDYEKMNEYEFWLKYF